MQDRKQQEIEKGTGFPGILRPGARTVVVSEWAVATAERQRSVIEAFAAALLEAPWPDGLLATTLLASTDGELVLNYAQWASGETYQRFLQARRQLLPERVDSAVPGIEDKPGVTYQLYRGGVRAGAPAPGCAVVVTVEFDAPDQQRQRRWVDSVFEAMKAEPERPAGGVSGHFHVSTDGLRVLNYAEWTDESAHQDAINRSGNGGIGSGPNWREVQTFAGIKSSGVKRYSAGLTLIPPQGQ